MSVAPDVPRAGAPQRAGPLRVVLVAGDLQPRRDGVSDYTARLAAHLRAGGAEAEIVAGSEAPDAGGPSTAWRRRDVVAAARAIRARRPDVVHLQFAPSAFAYRGGVGVLPLLLGDRPLLVTLHEYAWWAWMPRGVPERLARRLWPPLERRNLWDRESLLLAPRARRLVVTNAVHQPTVTERLPLARPPEVIPIGPNIDLAFGARSPARDEVRAELGAPGTAPLVVFFGFVHPVKGVEYLLDAVRELRRERPDLRLVVAGGIESLALRGREADEYRQKLEREIVSRGLAGAVSLTGWRPEDEVSRLLAAADAVALPFNQGVTTKSGSLLAALAHGAPTVVTDADPPDPVLMDGDTVLTVPRRDPAALATALRRVLGDPELAARLGGNGRRLGEAHAWPAIAAAHLDLYREVLDEGRRWAAGRNGR